jgi:hypothetical protein
MRKAIWPLFLLIAAIGIVFPANSIVTRLAAILGLIGFWGSLLLALWTSKAGRIVMVATGGLVCLFLVLPGRAVKPEVLRKEYVRALEGYEGVPYRWNGDNRFGIDALGLVRRAMIDANTRLGLLTLNPGLVRRAISLWWSEPGYDALKAGAGGRTKTVLSFDSADSLDYSKVQPGDLAFLNDKMHTLAYLGNRTWIVADVSPMKVIKIQAPGSGAIYMGVPGEIVRWKDLEG